MKTETWMYFCEFVSLHYSSMDAYGRQVPIQTHTSLNLKCLKYYLVITLMLWRLENIISSCAFFVLFENFVLLWYGKLPGRYT